MQTVRPARTLRHHAGDKLASTGCPSVFGFAMLYIHTSDLYPYSWDHHAIGNPGLTWPNLPPPKRTLGVLEVSIYVVHPSLRRTPL